MIMDNFLKVLLVVLIGASMYIFICVIGASISLLILCRTKKIRREKQLERLVRIVENRKW